MDSINFYGWDVLKYYFYVVQHQFVGWSWQILTAYAIVFLSILTIIMLAVFFTINVKKRKKHDKKQGEINEKYAEAFNTILCGKHMDAMEMLEILKKCEDKDDDDEIDKIKENAEFFIPILVKLRTEMGEIAFFPNLQTLVDVTGVREYCELRLLHNKDVFNTLQMMAMLQLVVSEGRLANYVNHKNNDIRMMARLCFIVCSVNDPYKYLITDLNENTSAMRLMMIHYIFAWMKAQNKKMPLFISTVDKLDNDNAAAFMIKETVFWGNDEEVKQIPTFFESKKYKCREAAIECAYAVNDMKAYSALVKQYPSETEELKRKILKAVAFANDDAFNNFFENAYHNSFSKETQEVALICLFHNGKNGRGKFADIEFNTKDEKIMLLFRKIESIETLKDIYNLC